MFLRVEKSKELVQSIDAASTIFRKVEYAVIMDLYAQLTSLSKYAQDLLDKGSIPQLEKVKEEIETIKEVLDEIKTEEYKDARKADYLRGEAAHLARRAKIELKGLARRLSRASKKLKVIAEREADKAKRSEDEAQKKLKEARELRVESKKMGG